MSSIALVGIVVVAAGFGGAGRYGLALWLNGDFPTGTLFANVVASGLLGFLISWGEVPELVLGLGFAGSLSTWSTLANEVATLFSTERSRLVYVYVGVTLVSGIGAAVAGLQLGSSI